MDTQISICNHSCVLMTDRESLKLNKYQPFQDLYDDPNSRSQRTSIDPWQNKLKR